MDQHQREKLVQAVAVLVFLFLIGILQEFRSSCSKLFEKLLLLKCYTGFFDEKTRLLEIFGKDSDFPGTWKTEICLCRVSFGSPFLN